MFGKCCGRSKKVDQGTQISIETQNSAPNNIVKLVNKEEPTPSTTETTPVIVIEQPAHLSSILKRQSVVSELKGEDDDEVFSEGVSNPIKLANNLGTPFSVQNEEVQLPQWFDSEQEVGGTQEPPATPVGRDELALRRHRLFSDLINASHNASEHKVWFDPLGPIVAGVDHECCHNLSNDLDSFVNRLEVIADRLEIIFHPVCELLKQSSLSLNSSNVPQEQPNMSVAGFQDILQGSFATYLKTSREVGGDVAEHALLVEKAFQAQLQFLVLANQSKAPSNSSEHIALLQPTSQQISAIQNFREKNRTSPYFHHLSAISESIPALGWVTVSPAPGPYVKEMNDAGQFYTNRVLKDFKEKDKKHVEWVKAWIQTLSDLQMFVKQHHTTGLVWAGKNAPTTGGIPPPPPGCPPPPPILCEDVAAMDIGNDRSALFQEINQGENITKNLKKVTADMQTHKNPTLRTGPAPFKPTHTIASVLPAPAVDKPPTFQRDGKKWLIEYQKGNHNLLVDNAEMNNVVYLFKCVDSTITVKGKLNSITLDSCKKTSIVFDSLVSSIEFINCQSVQMQVLGKVPTVSIDKTDGCQVYLSMDSKDVEIVCSKSSEMNILVPKGNGDYTEYPVPEQFKTTVTQNGLTTVAIESKG
ncbi:hypothetical protein FQR65_LT11075 [Abscondita terminalis]|nr:hypothetical protein FQR65_LT11075 [Abscondita terminalis]